MKLRDRPEDFRVRELLAEGYLREKGDFRIYRVTKRKMTTQDAARQLASDLGLQTGDVSFAGLKDRQAITTQYMSAPRGIKLRIREPEWKVEPVGFADEPLTGAAITGNAFELAIRSLRKSETRGIRERLTVVREHGLVNYFDDQRFGNLTHGQGWIARDFMQGRAEDALLALLASPGPRDNPHYTRFKEELRRTWGDWRECREVAGRFGEHHSIFEHLAKRQNDFAGAFTYVATRVRLIHLYAYQSHVWNRAVSELLRGALPLERRVVLECVEGPLVTFPEASPVKHTSFRLPGPGLEDVADDEQRALLTDALAKEDLRPEDFRIEGVPGFALKGEDRPLVVVPRHLRVRPPEPDADDPGRVSIRVRFELPPGSYATLVVKRLLTAEFGESRERPQGADREGGRTSTRSGGFGPGGGFERDRRSERSPSGGRPFVRRDRDDDPRSRGDRGDRGDRGTERPRSGSAGHGRDSREGRWARPTRGGSGRGWERERDAERGGWGAKEQPRPDNAPAGWQDRAGGERRPDRDDGRRGEDRSRGSWGRGGGDRGPRREGGGSGSRYGGGHGSRGGGGYGGRSGGGGHGGRPADGGGGSRGYGGRSGGGYGGRPDGGGYRVRPDRGGRPGGGYGGRPDGGGYGSRREGGGRGGDDGGRAGGGGRPGGGYGGRPGGGRPGGGYGGRAGGGGRPGGGYGTRAGGGGRPGGGYGGRPGGSGERDSRGGERGGRGRDDRGGGKWGERSQGGGSTWRGREDRSGERSGRAGGGGTPRGGGPPWKREGEAPREERGGSSPWKRTGGGAPRGESGGRGSGGDDRPRRDDDHGRVRPWKKPGGGARPPGRGDAKSPWERGKRRGKEDE